MRCPFCGSDDNQVKDSRPVEEGGAVRRRRQCNACGARFTTFERIDRIVNGIVREVELSGETEIEATRLGALAMQRLAELDQVAYVRFASVYHDFTGVRDFESLIARMASESERASAESDADVAAK